MNEKEQQQEQQENVCRGCAMVGVYGLSFNKEKETSVAIQLISS